MKRILVSLSAMLGLVGGILGVVAIDHAAALVNTYTAVLSATNEVPPNASGYTGAATITVNTTTFEVCVNATTNIPGADPISDDHIHSGAAGVNGPIVVPFSNNLHTCVVSDATTVGNIVANPSAFYFNVHNATFPGGAVRGQLALAQTIQSYTPVLSATNEVPPNASGYTGAATITVNTTTFEVCVNATTNIPGADPISDDHIHSGAAGVNGPIVVPFSNNLHTCVVSDATTVGNIVANPSAFYFNVHNATFPGGAVRGQLSLAAPTPLPSPIVTPPAFTG